MAQVLYGYPGRLLPLDKLLERPDVAGLHPEFLSRLLALIEASGYTVGIGGGSRTTAQQEAEFLRRHREDPAGPITWNGKRWTLKAGMAPLAPPDDRSYHLPTIDGKAIAADLIGDLPLAHELAPRFLLRDFRNVGTKPEPWHFQPVEVPTARREYNANPAKYPLRTWAPTPPPPLEENDMYALLVTVTTLGQRYIWTAGGRLMWLATPADADRTVAALRTAGVAVAAVEWSEDQLSAANNGGYYVAHGAA